MLFSRRRVLAVLAASSALAGCGFHPLYGDVSGSANVPDQFRSIYIAPIADRPGQMLRNDLVDEMQPRGRVADPVYRLKITLTESTENLGQKKSAFATRANLHLSANVVLYDQRQSKTALQTSVRVVSSYDILTDEYATLIAENNARENAIRTLSHEITLRLGSYFDKST